MGKKPIKNRKSSNSDTKLKPLSPTLRTKKRFVKAKIISDKNFDFKQISEDINEQIITFLGAIEFGKGGVWILKDKFSEKDQTIVIKVGTKTKDRLIAVLSLIQKINNQPAKVEVEKVSGTLKGLH